MSKNLPHGKWISVIENFIGSKLFLAPRNFLASNLIKRTLTLLAALSIAGICFGGFYYKSKLLVEISTFALAATIAIFFISLALCATEKIALSVINYLKPKADNPIKYNIEINTKNLNNYQNLKSIHPHAKRYEPNNLAWVEK